MRTLRGLFADRRGNIAIMTAFLAPLTLGFAGAGVDFYRWSNQRTELKELADMLATRGAREFLLANASPSQIVSVLESAVDHGAAGNFNLGAFTMDIAVDTVDAAVSVTLVQPPKPGLLLTQFSPYADDLSIRSTAVARGGMNVCVVALEDAAASAVSAESNAKLNAEECSIMSNSTSGSGVAASGLSKLSAALICSAGGYSGLGVNYDPLPTVDCPVYKDPLAKRAPPPVGPCDETNLMLGDENLVTTTVATVNVVGETATGLLGGDDPLLDNYTDYALAPGVYCGGLNIGSNADVTLGPGVYVIKDGPLIVALGGRLQGEHVAVHLVGDDATFYFEAESKIALTAPIDGPLAGVLFFEDRNAPLDRMHQILSADARLLLGTFYLPRGVLRVASALPVADSSAYTAIVAKKLDLAGSPTLVLNADYGSTDVPVPEGVGPVGGTTYLRE